MKSNKHTKQELIDMISSAFSAETNHHNVIPDLDMTKIASMTMKASKMLKLAATRTAALRKKAEELEEENDRLSKEVQILNLKGKAEKLAMLMNEKNIISKSDIPENIEKIMGLDENAYNLLKTAVGNAGPRIEKEGMDNLTFLDETYNINIRNSVKRSLQEAIEDDTM